MPYFMSAPPTIVAATLPDNISLLFLPPYAPELNPKENLWEPRENLQKLRPQIHRRRARQTQGGNPLHGTQARNCKIHHLIPLHSQVTLMWKWYQIEILLSADSVDYVGR
jgi:hypothetical protein